MTLLLLMLAAASNQSADAIYLEAVRTQQHDVAPAFMFYDVHADSSKMQVATTVDQNGHASSSFTLDPALGKHQVAYRVWYRSSDGRALAQDATTRAIEFASHPWPLPVAGRVSTLVLRGQASPSPSPRPTDSTETSLNAQRVLGDVAVDSSRYYRIVLVGLESVDGTPAYHLAMSAYRSENEHPLTDVYVDQATSHVRRAIARFNFRNVLSRVVATLDMHFADVGGYWINDAGSLTAEAHLSMFRINGSYSYAAAGVSFPTDIPAWYFEERR